MFWVSDLKMHSTTSRVLSNKVPRCLVRGKVAKSGANSEAQPPQMQMEDVNHFTTAICKSTLVFNTHTHYDCTISQ